MVTQLKQDQTGLDRSARSTLDFGAKGFKVSRSQGLRVSGSQGLRFESTHERTINKWIIWAVFWIVMRSIIMAFVVFVYKFTRHS